MIYVSYTGYDICIYNKIHYLYETVDTVSCVVIKTMGQKYNTNINEWYPIDMFIFCRNEKSNY